MLMQARAGQAAEAHRRPFGRGRGGERAVRARGRDTVARLLAAALAEFDERGFQAVTVDDIVRRAASVVTDSPHGPVALFERYVRRKMTQVLRREVASPRHGGARVTVLTPGPEDLAVMGGHLMDHRHREEVFETSMATSAAAMRQDPSRNLGAA